MTNYRLTPAASDGLSEIWDYPESRWDTGQAETHVREIKAAIERIAADPRRGHACDDIRAGHPHYGVGGHLVFNMETTDGVDVIRIVHQRMDPTRHL